MNYPSSDRIARLRFLLLAWLAFFSGGGWTAAAVAPPPASGETNILMIVLDDVGTDKLALFDDGFAPPYAWTPRLDELARRGIRFRNFYANPLCSTTRACMQTGRYPFRTGMGANSEAYALPDSEVLLAELLTSGFPNGQGYRCGAFGKWHLSQGNIGHAVQNGFHRFYGVPFNTNDHFNWYKFEHDAGSPPSGPIPMSTWSASVVRDDAVHWINDQQRPFFAWVSFNPPHRAWQVPPKALLSDSTRTALAGLPEGTRAGTRTERKLIYQAMLEAVDTEVGYLLDGIAPDKLANTMIFVVCDNGSEKRVIESPHDPEHGKATCYELGIRVPMIVSGPLVPHFPPAGGYECNELVSTVDFWRTIAAITGADEWTAFKKQGLSRPYPVLDSVSFLRLIRDPAALGLRAYAFAQIYGPSGRYSTSQCLNVHSRAITDGEWKYIRQVDKRGDGVPLCSPPVYTQEFYHVATDPEETVNLLLGRMTPAQTLIYDYLSREMDGLSEY